MSLAERVLLTLSYSGIWGYPLTLSEIKTRLIGPSSDNKSIAIVLQKLLVNKIISQKGNFYYCGDKKKDPFNFRKIASKLVKQKNQEIQSFLTIIYLIPWISAVFVTGSVAVGNVRLNDDIDFFIITNKNRLWLVRPILIFLTLLKNKVRLRNFHQQNSWCLNMWLETDCLVKLSENQSIYTAYEICQAKCVFDRIGVAKQILKTNVWVKQLLPQYYQQKFYQADRINLKKFSKIIQNNLIGNILNKFFDKLNYVLFCCQYWYMKPHLTKERVNLHQAFFHPRIMTGWVMKSWLKQLELFNFSNK